mmetsp:Transcript_5966/g.13060  ORF Transcript_5966/g.13060 Transcript_5966/m.13060 type:complete len:103 (+) Transcript_5966:824-1132(+)
MCGLVPPASLINRSKALNIGVFFGWPATCRSYSNSSSFGLNIKLHIVLSIYIHVELFDMSSNTEKRISITIPNDSSNASAKQKSELPDESNDTRCSPALTAV